jgi:hypothetical protein
VEGRELGAHGERRWRLWGGGVRVEGSSVPLPVETGSLETIRKIFQLDFSDYLSTCFCMNLNICAFKNNFELVIVTLSEANQTSGSAYLDFTEIIHKISTI